jgi:hypothetical protein
MTSVTDAHAEAIAQAIPSPYCGCPWAEDGLRVRHTDDCNGVRFRSPNGAYAKSRQRSDTGGGEN